MGKSSDPKAICAGPAYSSPLPAVAHLDRYSVPLEAFGGERAQGRTFHAIVQARGSHTVAPEPLTHTARMNAMLHPEPLIPGRANPTHSCARGTGARA